MLMTWPGLVTRRPRRSFDSADGFASRLRNARRLSAASRQLANASRERVQRCRALIGRKRMICGGSDDVRGIIRARVQAGELTELRGLAGARPARGQRCAGCDDAITAPDLEFELFGPHPVWMHPACYAIWLDETTSDAAMDSRGIPRGNGEVIAIADLVELESDTVGRVAAVLDSGRQVYVRWLRRPGYSGRVTQEHGATLRKLGKAKPVDPRLDSVSAKLRSGELQQELPRRTWYGNGVSRACSGCAESIAETEVQVDVEFIGAHGLSFHSPCFVYWRDEVERGLGR